MKPLDVHNIPPPRNSKLLRNLTLSEIQVILGNARARRFSRGSIITDQGEPSEHFYLLWKGRARYFYETHNGKKLILRWLTPGQAFGIAAIVSGASSYLVSVEAVQDSVALVWNARVIRHLARRYPRLLENALTIATDYMSWYVAAHASLTSQTARERLAHVLIGLAETVGHKLPHGIELDVSNDELASAANITPFTASRTISGWQKLGAIRKRRGKIALASTAHLFTQP